MTADSRILVGTLSAADHSTNLVSPPSRGDGGICVVQECRNSKLTCSRRLAVSSGPDGHRRENHPRGRRPRAVGRGAAGPLSCARRQRVLHRPGGREAGREHRLVGSEGRPHWRHQAHIASSRSPTPNLHHAGLSVGIGLSAAPTRRAAMARTSRRWEHWAGGRANIRT